MRLAIVVVTAIIVAACDQSDPQANAGGLGGALPARVMAPEKRQVVESDEYTGRFQAAQKIEVRARVSGYIQEVLFEDGQMVNKGDVLFVIDQRPFQIAQRSADATYRQDEREVERGRTLRRQNTIPENEFDRRVQQAQVSRAARDQAALNLEWTKVRAPITGRVSRNFIDAGNLVSGGDANATLLTTIISVDPIEFYFEGSEADVLRYSRRVIAQDREGQRVQAWPVFVKLQDEKDFVHQGRINFVDNELDPDTGTIQVRAVFDNPDGLLEAGLFGRLRLTTSPPREAVLVPDHIIGTEQTRRFVYTIDAESRAKRTYLELGTLTDDGLRIIRNGLSADDKIIVGNLQMIQPGTQIKPISGSKNSAAEGK